MSSAPRRPATGPVPSPGLGRRRGGRLARRAVLSRLGRITEGELELVEGARRWRVGPGGGAQGDGSGEALAARVMVRDPRFWRAVALGGTIGAARAYRDGWWASDDLVDVVRIVARNRQANTGLEGGLARLADLAGRAALALRRNSQVGSRRNIAAHYDLGNEFFALFLDPTLTYSSAIFADAATGLEAAQREKLDRICRKLDLGPGDEVLEIGTGWGSFALHAAGEHGARVTTTTISAAQHAEASRRVAAAGLGDRVTILELDYRALPALVAARGRFDKLASIEMIEAVGEAYLDDYLRVCAGAVHEDGAVAVQGILMADRHYAEYRRGADVIQRLVFPGSFLPALSDLTSRAGRETDLGLVDLEDLTPHYAETLRLWRERFLERRREVRRLGFSESFCRLWEFYLAYCEGGFREGVVRSAQLLFARPRAHWAPAAAVAARAGSATADGADGRERQWAG